MVLRFPPSGDRLREHVVQLRKGDKVVGVTYEGWDKTFFATARMPRVDAERAVEAVTNEILPRL